MRARRSARAGPRALRRRRAGRRRRAVAARAARDTRASSVDARAERDRCDAPARSAASTPSRSLGSGDPRVARAARDLARRAAPGAAAAARRSARSTRRRPAVDDRAAARRRERQLRRVAVRVGRGGDAGALGDVEQQLGGRVAPWRGGHDPHRQPADARRARDSPAGANTSSAERRCVRRGSRRRHAPALPSASAGARGQQRPSAAPRRSRAQPSAPSVATPAARADRRGRG